MSQKYIPESILDTVVTVVNKEKPDFTYTASMRDVIFNKLNKGFKAIYENSDASLFADESELYKSYDANYRKILGGWMGILGFTEILNAVRDKLSADGIEITQVQLLDLISTEVEKDYGELFAKFFNYWFIKESSSFVEFERLGDAKEEVMLERGRKQGNVLPTIYFPTSAEATDEQIKPQAQKPGWKRFLGL